MDKDELTTMEKLKGVENWVMWKFQTKVFLNADELFDLTANNKKPDRSAYQGETSQTTYEKELAVWRKNDSKAQKIIVRTLAPQPMMHVINCESAYDMWGKLQAVYEQKSAVSIHFLQEKFYSFVKDPKDGVALHISKLENLAQQLKDLGETISTSMLITRILTTLPTSFSHFTSAWESTSTDDQTLENLTSRLLIEEARHQTRDGSEASDALVARRFQQSRNKTSGKSGNCFGCGQKGHYKYQCPHRRSMEYSTGENTSEQSSIREAHFNQQQMQSVELAGGGTSRGTQPTNVRRGDAYVIQRQRAKPANNSNFKKGEAFISIALFTEAKEFKSLFWWMDSGASDHMSYKKEWFVEYERFSEPFPVRIGNGKTILAHGKGCINILSMVNGKWCEKHLEDVLYVPDIHVNLFSAITALDRGLRLEADSRICKFLRGNEIVGMASRERGLFRMMFKVISNSTVANVATKQVTSLKTWHERFGHQNIFHVKQYLKNAGINFSDHDRGDFFCEGCIKGKHHRMPFINSQNRAGNVGQLVHSDVCGPMHEISFGGSKYFVLFKDDYSNYRTVYFIQKKSEVAQLVEKYVRNVKSSTSYTVAAIRTDNGLEYINNYVKTFTDNHGIQHQRTVPHTPEQNGRAERDMRTVVEAARSMIHSKNLSLKYWAEAVNTAVYVLNRTGPSPMKGKTPHELWFKRKPTINHLRCFGSEVFSHVPKEKRRKWDSKAIRGIFVGYCDNTKGYRVWFPDQQKIGISRDIVFREDEMNRQPESTSNDGNFAIFQPESKSLSIDQPSNRTVNYLDSQTFDESIGSIPDQSVIEILDSSVADETVDSDNTFQSVETVDDMDDPTWNPDPDELDYTSSDTSAAHFCHTSESSESFWSNMVKGCAFILDSSEPKSYQEAMNSLDCGKWVEAMNSEISSLKRNHTWDLVNLPEDRKVIDNKWIFKLKHNSAGDVERFKARLVIRGFTQQHGVDYFETFSPVVKLTSVRMIIAIAASENLKLKQFDVDTAFLYGSLDEEIYMCQPKGYEDRTNRVCKLNKSLYGLKQASRVWNQKFTDFLKRFEFKVCASDNCVFVGNIVGRKIFLAIWIDDGLVAATSEQDIEELLSYLHREFAIKVADGSFFVGLQINRLDDGSIHVNQSTYAKKVLTKFNMMDACSVDTPADANTKLLSNLVDGKLTTFPYREAVGSLMYLAVATRPDISFAVGLACRYLNRPNENHVNAVKRIFRYIRGTISFGIRFNSNVALSLECFSDADYAGDVDTRKSTSGFVFMFGNGSISWGSNRQKCVALSSTESEYIAGSEAVKELLWLQRMLIDLDVTIKKPGLHLDNQGAMKLTKNPEFHKRTKHIEVRYHFIREKFDEGCFELRYVSTKEQIADIFTKPLSKHKFQYFRKLMGMCPMY